MVTQVTNTLGGTDKGPRDGPAERSIESPMKPVATKVLPTGQLRGTTVDPQRTLARVAIVRGKGLMLGEEAILEITPAPPGTGIIFERVDLNPTVTIPALVTHV